eukprot:1147823-Pelagomonas_calceolata.AAC.9
MDLFLAGRDQPQADQPNALAEEELVQMKRPSRMVGKKAGQPEEEEKEPTSNMEKIMRNMNLKA